jgi:mannose-6-phosphate isomerase
MINITRKKTKAARPVEGKANNLNAAEAAKPVPGFITFKPVFKKLIWGGSKIAPFKGIDLAEDSVGESWELSHVDGHVSVVDAGPLAGKSIDDLIDRFGERLLGRRTMQRFGKRFPLLVKFIDAADDLSVQVHPDDELARERHASWGKTEMWYVVKADKGASLYTGFKPSENFSAENTWQLIKSCAEGNRPPSDFTNLLMQYEVKPGDTFFLPAGRVHAIGKGCLVAEIQQTSNITYRIYDYNRVDKNGFKRELHIKEARDAISYFTRPDYKTAYIPRKNSPVTLESCRYFTTRLLDLDRKYSADLAGLDSFVIYMCTSGSLRMSNNHGETIALKQGQTALVPAEAGHITLNPTPESTVLEIYLEERTVGH